MKHKHLACLLLSGAMLLSLAACGAQTAPASSSASSSQSAGSQQSTPAQPNAEPQSTQVHLTLDSTAEEGLSKEICVRPDLLSVTENVDGLERTWELYIPSTYDGSQAVPLLMALHGNGGPTMPMRSTWHLIAEREGFIVVYPQGIGGTWNIWDKNADGPNDTEFLDVVYDRVIEDYNIDETRLYLTGQSMGDMMGSTYLFKHGDRIAAAALTSGASLPSNLCNEDGELVVFPTIGLPVIRTHGTKDLLTGYPSTHGVSNDDYNAVITPEEQLRLSQMIHGIMKKMWIDVNQVDETPALKLTTRSNYEIYTGQTDFVYETFVGMGHAMYADTSEGLWNDFLKNYSRVDGKIVVADHTVTPDQDCVALAVGSAQAYVDNKLVDLCSDSGIVTAEDESGVVYVPVTFLETAFPGTKVDVSAAGDAAVLTYGGQEVQLACGQYMMLQDNHAVSIYAPYLEGQTMMVPVQDMAERVYGYHYLYQSGSIYLTDQDAVLSDDCALTIGIILGTRERPTADVAFELECLERIQAHAASK